MKVSFIGSEPEVMFTLKAWTQIRAAVSYAKEEVSWLGLAERVENNFLIKEIFIPVQEVHITTTEITDEGQCGLYEQIIASGKDSNSLCYHGHSHHSMGVKPSHQDNEEFFDFDSSFPFFIRSIHNKSGDIHIDVIDREKGIVLEEVEYDLVFDEQDELRVAVVADIDRNVSKLSVVPKGYKSKYAHHYGISQKVKSASSYGDYDEQFINFGTAVKRELIKVSDKKFAIVRAGDPIGGKEVLCEIYDEAWGGERIVVKNVKNEYCVIDNMAEAKIGYWKIGTVKDVTPTAEDY